MFPKSGSASSVVEPENKGDGMRTERVTLEITGAPWWKINVIGRDVESMRVVTDQEREAEAAQLRARVAELEAEAKFASAANADAGSNHAAPAASGAVASVGSELVSRLGRFVADLKSGEVDMPSGPPRAASGGNCQGSLDGSTQEPAADAWGVVRNGSVESVAHRRFRRDADDVAEEMGGTVVPLYRSPPPPPVVEQEPVAWREHVEQMLRDWWSPTINELGDRATLEQFIGEEGLDSLLDFVLDEGKGPPPSRGWLSAEEREAVETARDFFHDDNPVEPCDSFYLSVARMMKQILARSTPPEVVLPGVPDCSPMGDYGWGWREAIEAAGKALAAAGVAVKEVGRE